MFKTYPTKFEYEAALKIVQKYDNRQETLKRLANDLSFHLQSFKSVKFKVNKKEGKVVFSGLIGDQIKIGESVCSTNDVFNETIGKLVAVKKALGLDTKDVIEHVEFKGFPIFINSGGIVADKLVAGEVINKLHSNTTTHRCLSNVTTSAW